MMFRIGIIFYIGVLTLSSLLSCYSVQAVTAFDPCDPLQANVTAHSVFREKMILMIQEMKVPPIWFITPLRYVNCSRRGINRIPQSIASNVQHLDLSSNALDRVETKDLVKYKDLQILILYSNCIGNSRHRANYCYGLRGAYDKHAFKSLLNLRYLDVGGNNFLNFPPNLPSRLEYLEVSRSGFQKITAKDVNYLKNLSVFVAQNMCFYCGTKGHLSIDANAFANIPVQVVAVHENQINKSTFSNLRFQEVSYLNLAISSVKTLDEFIFENIPNVQVLDLHLLNPT